jgi:GDP-L-fucose synthase
MRDPEKVVFVAGHRGMVGAAIVRRLQELGYKNIVTRSKNDLDLTRQEEVERFFSEERIDEVYLAAAKVGGIHANNVFPAEFIYENLAIECNIIHAAHMHGVQKLLFLGSSCIYPKHAPQPMREKALLQGSLEPTNEPYAVAKIAGIKLCESYNRQYGRDYRSVMPTNLYGPNDNFHAENSHVIPALIRRIHEAKRDGAGSVTVWGTGNQRREFLHVDDMAEASVHVMELDSDVYYAHTSPMLSHINVGTGKDCSIREVAETIAAVIGYAGAIAFDVTKPDGTPRKLLETSCVRALGWRPKIELTQGIRNTYAWFVENEHRYRA